MPERFDFKSLDLSNKPNQKKFDEEFENLPEKEEGEIIEDKKENKEKIIVEIGHGGQPIYREDYSSKLKKDIKEHEHYIGIDFIDSTSVVFPKLSSDILKKIKKEGIEKEKGKIDFIAGSGENLPLADESVDHIIFKNVFGAGRGKKGSAEILINEAIRVLKESGELEMIETYTPDQASGIIMGIIDYPKYDFNIELDKFITFEMGKDKDGNRTIKSEKEVNKEELLLEIKLDREGLSNGGAYVKNNQFLWYKPFRIIFIKKENKK